MNTLCMYFAYEIMISPDRRTVRSVTINGNPDSGNKKKLKAKEKARTREIR